MTASGPVRGLTAALHRLDHAIGRMRPRRRVLADLRTPVCQAVLGPVCDALEQRDDIELWFTSEYPDRLARLVGPRLLTHREVEWMRFDLYLNADAWAAARLRRCAARINFFHGVAGKYDLDQPRHLPMGFEYYDRVAFINRDRMHRYLEAGIVTDAQARLVGYPKLDALAAGRVDGTPVRASVGLDPGRPTVLYAPTYSPASSLHIAGEAIVNALAAADMNVLIKLHDRSLDPDPRYTAGIDWRARMRRLERPGQVAYVEASDASPYLAAADLLVTDHSSIGFEYLVLDRPLVVFDAPGLIEAARINPEKVALLRTAADVVSTPSGLVLAVRRALAAPERLSSARRRVAGEIFHEPGRATSRAVALVHELIDAPATRTRPIAERPASPGRVMTARDHL